MSHQCEKGVEDLSTPNGKEGTKKGTRPFVELRRGTSKLPIRLVWGMRPLDIGRS